MSLPESKNPEEAHPAQTARPFLPTKPAAAPFSLNPAPPAQPNPLIDETLPVVCIATKDPADPSSALQYEPPPCNIQEFTARSGRMIAIATEGDEDIAQLVEHVIHIHPAPELLLPIQEVVPPPAPRPPHSHPPRLRRRPTPQPSQIRHRRVMWKF